jgi:hypothetical protein
MESYQNPGRCDYDLERFILCIFEARRTGYIRYEQAATVTALVLHWSFMVYT